MRHLALEVLWKNVAKISAIHGLYGKVAIRQRSEMFCNLGEQLHDKNCRIRNTFYFEAARRVEDNYVKTRTNNQRIFHANGHEKKNEEVEEVINLIRMISEPW